MILNIVFVLSSNIRSQSQKSRSGMECGSSVYSIMIQIYFEIGCGSWKMKIMAIARAAHLVRNQS